MYIKFTGKCVNSGTCVPAAPAHSCIKFKPGFRVVVFTNSRSYRFLLPTFKHVKKNLPTSSTVALAVNSMSANGCMAFIFFLDFPPQFDSFYRLELDMK